MMENSMIAPSVQRAGPLLEGLPYGQSEPTPECQG